MNKRIEEIEKSEIIKELRGKSQYFTASTIEYLLDRVRKLEQQVEKLEAVRMQAYDLVNRLKGIDIWLEPPVQELRKACEESDECPPHSWDRDGERCAKCGQKDWM